LARELLLDNERLPALAEAEGAERALSLSRRLDDAVARIRILDPAVGSGAFLLGMMSELIRLRRGCHRLLEGREAGARELWRWKLHPVEPSLFGGDVNPTAIDPCPLPPVPSPLAEEGSPPGASNGNSAAPRPLLKLAEVEANEADRIPTGVAELDRVLGGGLVPSSLVLVGGEPGVGKSTLLLSALRAMGEGRRVLLVTGEESPAQVRLRAERLGLADAAVQLAAETLRQIDDAHRKQRQNRGDGRKCDERRADNRGRREGLSGRPVTTRQPARS